MCVCRFRTRRPREDAAHEEVGLSDSNHTYNRKKMAPPAKVALSKSSALQSIYGEIIYTLNKKYIYYLCFVKEDPIHFTELKNDLISGYY